MLIENLAKQGRMTTYGSMVESVSAKILDLRKKAMKDNFMDFHSQQHRLEFVAKVHGVEFINDSMACNINATWYALENMTKPTIWIVSAQKKAQDYSMLLPLVKNKVKAIICLGGLNKDICEAFEDYLPIVEKFSAQQVVDYAHSIAVEGDVVLLSPACPSFELFESYEDRGIQFKRAINEL